MFSKDKKKNNHGSIGDHKLHAGVLFYEMNNICVVLRSESLSGKCAKLHTVAASNNRDHMPWSLYYSLFVPHIYMWLFFTHIPFVVNRTFNATPTERLQQHHLFLQRIMPIAHSFCEGCTWHDLHILVTAPFCYDRKAQVASVQSFTLWQQATIEITCHDHSSIACLRHIYTGAILHAHPICGGSHIQHNANWEVATVDM